MTEKVTTEQDVIADAVETVVAEQQIETPVETPEVEAPPAEIPPTEEPGLSVQEQRLADMEARADAALAQRMEGMSVIEEPVEAAPTDSPPVDIPNEETPDPSHVPPTDTGEQKPPNVAKVKIMVDGQETEVPAERIYADAQKLMEMQQQLDERERQLNAREQAAQPVASEETETEVLDLKVLQDALLYEDEEAKTKAEAMLAKALQKPVQKEINRSELAQEVARSIRVDQALGTLLEDPLNKRLFEHRQEDIGRHSQQLLIDQPNLTEKQNLELAFSQTHEEMMNLLGVTKDDIQVSEDRATQKEQHAQHTVRSSGQRAPMGPPPVAVQSPRDAILEARQQRNAIR